MKNVLIVTNNMCIGGIQKSLLELLKVLAKRDDISVTLFCCNATGEFLQRVPKEITLLPENKWAKVSEYTVKSCKQLGLKYALFRVVSSFWSKAFNKGVPAKILCKKIGNLGCFDIAISYSQPINDKAFCTLTNEIVLNCCTAKKKVTFVHCDFDNYGGNTRLNRKLYEKFDSIAVVSNSVGSVLSKNIPTVKEKIKTVYNFLDKEEIISLSEDNPVIYDRTSLVTVARLSEEKGLLRCVPIMAKLREQSIDFVWYIVGGGVLETQLKESICKYAMDDVIFLEGAQDNPYRYIKHADYLFLPSFHEAAPIVFDEAIALNVPILATDTLLAKELVLNRNAGLICDNTENAIYDMLHYVLTSSVRKFNMKSIDFKMNMSYFNEICTLEKCGNV